MYRALLGTGTDVVSVSAGGVVTYGYVAPAAYPDVPFLWCDTVELVEGVEGSGGRSVGRNGMVAYKYARLKATYRVPDGLEVGSLQIDYSGEVLTLPQDVPTLEWVDDGTDVPSEVNAPLNISMAKLSITLKTCRPSPATPSCPSRTT